MWINQGFGLKERIVSDSNYWKHNEVKHSMSKASDGRTIFRVRHRPNKKSGGHQYKTIREFPADASQTEINAFGRSIGMGKSAG